MKINKSYFDIDTEIFLAGVYIWDERSPAYNEMDVNLFDILQDDIFAFSQLGSVLVCGDCNARVGNGARRDFIVNDRGVDELDNEYQPDNDLKRVSLVIDTTTNSHGIKLLDMCKGTSLRLANGRLRHDKLVGSYTFFVIF